MVFITIGNAKEQSKWSVLQRTHLGRFLQLRHQRVMCFFSCLCDWTQQRSELCARSNYLLQSQNVSSFLEQKFRTMKACYMVASNGTAMWNIKEARLSHCMHKTNKNDFQISLKSRITRQELWLNNYGLFIRRGKHSGWTPAHMSVRVWELLSLIPWIRTTNSSN